MGSGQTGVSPPNIDNEAMSAAADVSEAAVAASKPSDMLTLSNGVVLRIGTVSAMALRMAQQQYPEPKPLNVTITMSDGRTRDEENPDDPHYEEAVKSWEARVNEVAMNVMVLVGVRVEAIPDSLPKIEDDEWVDMLSAAGIEIDVHNEVRRRMAWLRTIGISTTGDFLEVVNAVATKSGLREEDVTASVRAFQDRTGRATDNGAAPAGGSEDGHQVRDPDPIPGAGV